MRISKCNVIIVTIIIIRSLDDPPDHPAFKGGRQKAPNQVHALTTAVTEMARAMTSAGGTPSSATAVNPTVSSGSGISPGKIANLRCNYLQQMFAIRGSTRGGYSRTTYCVRLISFVCAVVEFSLNKKFDFSTSTSCRCVGPVVDTVTEPTVYVSYRLYVHKVYFHFNYALF